MQLPGGWSAWSPMLALVLAYLLGYLFTRLAAARYRPVPPAAVRGPAARSPVPGHELSVVTLIAGHDPQSLARGLESWLANDVRRVIVLIGAADEACHEVLENYPVTVIRRRNDLRLDLRAGWRAAPTDLVAFAEPGVVWARDLAPRVVAAAAQDDVAAIAVRQNAGHATGLLPRLADMGLDTRAFGTAAAGTWRERAVTGTWQGTAVFRRTALLRVEHEFLQESVPAIGPAWLDGHGERLAELMLVQGWAAVLQRTARIWTPMPRRARQIVPLAFAQGGARWPLIRRGLSPVLIRRAPYRAACLAYEPMAGLITLLALGYAVAAARAGATELVLTLAGWAVFVRCVVLLPHLVRRPGSLPAVPLHLATEAVAGLARSAGVVSALVAGVVTRLAGPVFRRMAARRAGSVPAGGEPGVIAPEVAGEPPGLQIDPALRLLPARTAPASGMIRLPVQSRSIALAGDRPAVDPEAVSSLSRHERTQRA